MPRKPKFRPVITRGKTQPGTGGFDIFMILRKVCVGAGGKGF